MKITNLSYTNFKGHSGSYDLDAVNLIAAPNFAHKTTIPLAIRLGMTGYLPPPIGTRGIYKLAGNPNSAGSMSIDLKMDNGRLVQWIWKRNEAGKVSCEGGLSKDITMPELQLDPRLFFSKTKDEQIALIFAACKVGPDKFSPETIRKRLGEVNHPPHNVCQETLQKVCTWMETNEATNIPAWLANFIAFLKLSAKRASEQNELTSGAFAAFRIGGDNFQAKDYTEELKANREKLAALKQVKDSSHARSRLALLEHKLRDLGDYAQVGSAIAELKTKLAVKPFADDDDVESLLEDLVTESGARGRASSENAGKEVQFAKEIRELETSECCPKCLSAKPGWKKAALTRLTLAHATALKERDANAKLADESRKRLLAIRAWVSENNRLQNLERIAITYAELITNVEQAREEVAELEKVPVPTEEIAQLEAWIADAETKQKQHEVFASDSKRREVLSTQLMTFSCEREVYKQVIGIVQEEQAKLIEGAFGKVLETAKYFSDGLLNSPLEFVDGALGRKVSQRDIDTGSDAMLGSWISFDAFSGTEELLALAGFSVALTADAPIKLVILDEMGRLDDSRKLDVAQRMLSLTQSGIIDQAILIDVSSKSYAALYNRPGFLRIQI